METNFVNDVRSLEAHARVAVQSWRNRGESRAHAWHALSQSIVKSGGAQDAWREISRHIEIAVAEGQPYFALVELERVTDSLGRELCRSEPRILSTSDQAAEIVRAGYLRLDGDRVGERLERVMDRIRLAGGRLENDPDVLTEMGPQITLIETASELRRRVCGSTTTMIPASKEKMLAWQPVRASDAPTSSSSCGFPLFPENTELARQRFETAAPSESRRGLGPPGAGCRKIYRRHGHRTMAEPISHDQEVVASRFIQANPQLLRRLWVERP